MQVSQQELEPDSDSDGAGQGGERPPETGTRKRKGKGDEEGEEEAEREGRLTISSVHTRRIQTFTLWPSHPSTSASSTPSHQQRRAGFRQNRSSF